MSVSFRGTENYVASPELMGAVDIAVALQKPLLIKGEPVRARPCWRRPSPTRWARSSSSGT